MLKSALIFLCFISVSCSTLNSDFDYKGHCSADAYQRVKEIAALKTKDVRGETTRAERDRMNRIRLVNRAYEEQLKLQVFECLAEYEATGVKGELSVCTVAETDQSGKISFLEVNDRTKKLNPRLRTCMEEKIRAFDFSKYPDVIAVQSINIELNP